jgi:S-(hydroxymethyl)glutathione dehydrogenase/alcohol dehydrogenase
MLDHAMKAAVLNDYGQALDLEEVRLDPPKPGEVQVRIGATGVCHSDYHVIKGEWKYGLPMILGHEAAGVVEEVGAGVTGVRGGDHAVISFRPACGVCRLCAMGRSVLCEGPRRLRAVGPGRGRPRRHRLLIRPHGTQRL